ncbi:F-box/LRR-repeat protein At3g26922-like [Lolium rigidum]|uniref:F-box/LRR-repeat protein At3g26922-like n=1 Tax=Lolium rigidum TaxID=89674 RepID=UPI001F5C1CCF|nr:F-box/LRR-repeat protein At3g26922-like [Lolium rigidum]
MAAALAQPRSGGDDRISELPEALLSDILSRLGTAEAARTVVLSTRFRDAWLGTPLRLDDLQLPAPARGTVPSIEPWTARADAITRALASHPGPVPLFRLSRTTFRGRVSAAEAWFRDLAARGAREVSLRCSPEWCHEARADPLLGSPTLEVLALGKCRLTDAGASAAAAARLTELTLSETSLSEAGLQSALSGCPALRTLMLKHVHGIQRIRVSSCRSLVFLGVWHYKQLEEITVEDAPCLERLLGNIRLNAAITIAGAPKLTALGYVVASIPMSFLGETAPAGVDKGIRAPIQSVKVLAISVKFSKKEDMEKAISVLEFFPFLETLHVQSSDPSYEVAADENDAIVSDYYQQCDPISCLTRHLRIVRLECEHHNRSMLEFACFLLARAHVLQFIKIQSRMSTNQQNLLKQSHMASLDAEVVFENVKDRESFTLEAVTALSDPFDGDTNILGY